MPKFPKISQNFPKFLQNFPKFFQNLQNFSTWQFFLHEYNSWYLWQIWALIANIVFPFYAIKYSKNGTWSNLRITPSFYTSNILSLFFSAIQISQKKGVWPNSRITPNFLQFKYPLFLSFYNSECSKKKGKNIQSLSQLSAVQIFPPLFLQWSQTLDYWGNRQLGKVMRWKNIIPLSDICQFWYITALFRPVKVHQMNEISQKNSPHWPKI